MTEPLWRNLARKLVSKVRLRPPLLQSGKRAGFYQRTAIQRKIRELGPWFHNMNIAKGLWTHPENEGAGPDYPGWRWNVLQPIFPNVDGKSCLDIGCSSGFFSLKMKEQGARQVLGVDQGEQVRAIEQARFAAATTGLEVDFQTMSVYDVHSLKRQFDVILFLGVFYHLRHPLLALESIRQVCNGTLLLQTITTPHDIGPVDTCPEPSKVHTGLRSPELNQPDFPLLRFVEGGLDGDTSCWFIPSVDAVLALLRTAGFRPEQMIRPTAHEVIVRASV